MGTAIICIVLGIVCIVAVRMYAKSLKHGCCGSGGDAVKKTDPADTNRSHYPYEKRVQIEGMTCKNCAARIENAFHKLDGYYAQVNLGKQQMILLAKKDVFDAEVKSIIAGVGYLAREIQSCQNMQYHEK